MFFLYLFPPGGNFDIDAGDGDGGGGHLGLPKSKQITYKLKKSLNNYVFPYFSPRKGTLTLTSGMGDGEEGGNPKHPKHNN